MTKLGIASNLVKAKKKMIIDPPEYETPDQIIDKDITKLAKELYWYSVNGLKQLRELYPLRLPKDLTAHEQFYKDTIANSAIFLAETENWYPPLNKKE